MPPLKIFGLPICYTAVFMEKMRCIPCSIKLQVLQRILINFNAKSRSIRNSDTAIRFDLKRLFQDSCPQIFMPWHSRMFLRQ